jgi:hypothetical protein
MHAAASEPRVRRVIAWDTLTDFYTCMTRTLPPALRKLADEAVNADAQSKFELALHDAAANSPFLDWGLKQGQHVFGSKNASGVFVRARDFHTRDVPRRIRQDVLLTAGRRDHAVPLEQAFEQARLLSAARSTAIRVFTEDEYAQMHCQLGMESWAEERASAKIKA